MPGGTNNTFKVRIIAMLVTYINKIDKTVMKHLKLFRMLLFFAAIPFFTSACNNGSDPVSSNDEPQRQDGEIYGKTSWLYCHDGL